jgi:hypothetical protein
MDLFRTKHPADKTSEIKTKYKKLIPLKHWKVTSNRQTSVEV